MWCRRARPVGPATAPLRPLLALLLLVVLVAVEESAGQSTLERSPNLSGGWVGEPGALHFHLLHRFWIVQGSGDDKLVNSPTMQVAAPLPGRTLVGLNYASNSLVTPGTFNEWEIFGRWSPPLPGSVPVELVLGAGYNGAAGSVDGEFALARTVGPLRLLGSVRAFTDSRNSGETGWSLGGGAVLEARDNLALAADLGVLRSGGERSRPAWGAGLQFRIPTTPHTVSIQATNTRTGTLQGASVRDRTTWGFEFTVPITFDRYIRRGGGGEPVSAGGAAPPAGDPPPSARERPADTTPRDAPGVVEVTMTDDLRFVPDTLEIQVGDTVVWRNTSSVVHTVTAHPDRVPDPDAIRLPEGAEPFDSGNLFEDQVFGHVFTVPGEYHYICVPHPMMVGIIRVRE